MTDIGFIETVHLFPEERALLLSVLADLDASQWSTPTICPGWEVKDIGLHLLGVDISNISRRRDNFHHNSKASTTKVDESEASLVHWLAAFNDSWVTAARRTSPRLLCELLSVTGDLFSSYLASLDPHAMGPPVSWAGPEAAPVWLDIAREYSERWVHGAQIRDSVGLPIVSDPRFFSPVLATFVHALPFTLRDVDRPQGTTLRLTITGGAGGGWIALRDSGRWRLIGDDHRVVDAEAMIGQDVAWRLFTRGMSKGEAGLRGHFTGDTALATNVLDMVSIIA